MDQMAALQLDEYTEMLDADLLSEPYNILDEEPDDDLLKDNIELEGDPTNIGYNDSNSSEINNVRAYLQDISKFTILTDIKELQLFQRLSNGDQLAKETIIHSNLRLVIKPATKYINSGVAFLDLIQAGNEGLMKCVDKFDYQKGYKFSTYATWWIRQSIIRYIYENGRNIRIPENKIGILNKMKQFGEKYTAASGMEPKYTEVAAALNIKEEQVGDLFRLREDTVSLDIPVGEDEDSTRGNFIESDGQGPFDIVAGKMLKDQLSELMDILTSREKEVLQLRFGWEDGCERTYEEVGSYFGVSRGRVKQIETKALQKLRAAATSQKIEEYLR